MDEIVTLIIVIGASAIAVGLLVVLNAFIGGWQPARLTDTDAAATRIEADVLGFESGPARVLDGDRTAALIFERDGRRLGLAVCRGDGVTVRALRPQEIVGVDVDGSQLVLTLDDYTLRQVKLRLCDEYHARRWADDLTGFISPPVTEMADAEPA